MEGHASGCECLTTGKCTCGADCKCGTVPDQTTQSTVPDQTTQSTVRDQTTKGTVSGQTSGEVHAFCSCGENCGCNPCTCSKVDVARAGKAYCKCGEKCGCSPCMCARADVPIQGLA